MFRLVRLRAVRGFHSPCQPIKLRLSSSEFVWLCFWDIWEMQVYHIGEAYVTEVRRFLVQRSWAASAAKYESLTSWQYCLCGCTETRFIVNGYSKKARFHRGCDCGIVTSVISVISSSKLISLGRLVFITTVCSQSKSMLFASDHSDACMIPSPTMFLLVMLVHPYKKLCQLRIWKF